MKKTSRKLRKNKKKEEIEKRKQLKQIKQQNKNRKVTPNTLQNERPLSGMVIKKRNEYVPAVLEGEILSAAYGNEMHTPKSRIILKPKAVNRLHSFIGWGAKTKANAVEQQGIMVGEVYQTPSGYVGVVEDVLLSSAIGNSVYVESAHSQWYEMDLSLERMNEGRKNRLVKVGWWHTHPNMSVFMSGTDRRTQELYFSKDWQFAVVLNPQDRKWAVFIGGQAESCEGYFLNRNLSKTIGGETV